jgi:hypothetical protein
VGDTYADEIAWMKSWTSNRLEWIEKQFVPAPVAATDNTGRVTLSAAQGRVLFTLDGSDPRRPGGTASDTAKEFSQPVTLAPGQTMMARVLRDGRWSGLVRRVASR